MILTISRRATVGYFAPVVKISPNLHASFVEAPSSAQIVTVLWRYTDCLFLWSRPQTGRLAASSSGGALSEGTHVNCKSERHRCSGERCRTASARLGSGSRRRPRTYGEPRAYSNAAVETREPRCLNTLHRESRTGLASGSVWC